MSWSTSRGSEPANTHICAPWARYRSLSQNRSTSALVTAGPRSLISVCSPLVGSSTAVLVRDSSRMRTKSDRIDSSVSSSTTRVPVAPPVNPVATTGRPRRLIARATLTPLPPGIVVWATLRCRRPSRKFGTSRVLSIAALSVTVMITRSGPPPSAAAPDDQEDREREQKCDREGTRSGDERHGPLDRPDLGDFRAGQERHPGDHAAAVDNADVADLATRRQRAGKLLGRVNHELRLAFAAAHHGRERARGHEPDRGLAVADL